MISSPPPPPVFVQHPARPTWGHCIVVAERDGKIHLHCEDGEEHAIAITHRAQLVSVSPSPEEQEVLVAQILGRRSASAARAARAAKKAAQKPKAPRTPQLTWDQQLERLAANPTTFTASTDPGVALAQASLTAAALSGPDAWTAIQNVVAGTTLLHPMEGQIPLRQIGEAHRAPIAAALSTVLHGAGDYAARFDAYVAAFAAAKAEGAQKGPSWPLTTLLPALHAPSQHVFVKPKLLQEQARILGLPIDYVSVPNGAIYEQFRGIVKAVSDKLKGAGQAPRDLMDALRFTWTTLAPAPAPAPAAAAPVAPTAEPA